ncbi:hypothetical protein Tco_0517670, partial [Tanacetum coccineum]
MRFSNFRIPLSKFFLCVLEYYQINFSQLSVLAATNISHFEIMCRIHRSPPTIGVSVKRDPLPSDDVIDLPLLERLNEGRAAIRKYHEVFLFVIGLSQSFVDDDVRSTFMGRDGREMGLLDFVKSSNPFKVKTGERTLAENKVSLLRETEERVISPSREFLLLVDHTFIDELQSVAGKRKRKVAYNADLPLLVKKVRDSSSAAPLERNPTTAGKTLATLENLDESADNVRTRLASVHYVVLTASFELENTDVSASIKVNSPIPYVQIEVEAVASSRTHETGTSVTPRKFQ